jgi:hypothetical protein
MARKRTDTQHILDDVERKRCQPPTEQKLGRILAKIASPNENVRAEAVRDLCPCRVPWPVYQQNIGAVQALQKDTSPQVRQSAQHLTEDALWLERMEERCQQAERRLSDEVATQRRRSSRGGRGPRGTG